MRCHICHCSLTFLFDFTFLCIVFSNRIFYLRYACAEFWVSCHVRLWSHTFVLSGFTHISKGLTISDLKGTFKTIITYNNALGF